jgi:uncharacterized protein YkwD
MRRVKTRAVVLTLLTALGLSACTDAEGGVFRRRPAPSQTCYGGTCYRQPTHCVAPVATAQAPRYAPVQAVTAVAAYQTTAATFGTDTPAGFVGWLNATRAAYGLPAVGWDAELAVWAAANSAEQARRGLGHFIMGPARRQNSAMGGGIASMWMRSPAHRSALLDPTIRRVGLAWVGSYSTFNAY